MEVSGDRFANARQRLAHGGGHHIDTSVIRCRCRNDSARQIGLHLAVPKRVGAVVPDNVTAPLPTHCIAAAKWWSVQRLPTFGAQA